MVYVLSFVVYVCILGLGVTLIKKNALQTERSAAKIAFVGFCIQIFINWSSLGNVPAMPQMTAFNVGKHPYLDFMILALISIFCYASILVIFYKTHDYYHEENQKIS